MNKKGQAGKMFGTIVIFLAMLFLFSSWVGSTFMSDKFDMDSLKNPVKSDRGITDIGSYANIIFELAKFQLIEGDYNIIMFFGIVIPSMMVYIIIDLFWIG